MRDDVDDRVELTRFEGYWHGPAKNSGLTLKIVPDDIMRGRELCRGNVDLAAGRDARLACLRELRVRDASS